MSQFSDSYQYDSPFGSNQNEFSRLSQVIGTNIQKISQNVSSMQKMVNQLGTSQDSESLRAQLHQLQHYTNQLAKDTNRHIRELAQLPQSPNVSEQKQRKILRERLTNDFSEALKNLQSVQRIEADKEKDSVKRARAASGLALDDGSASGQNNLIELASPTQIQSYAQMEDEVNLELLREREQSIRKLESDIVDVNQIFKDLATLVHEQGDIIDSIEANVESATIGVQEGTQQLEKARKHQERARRKMFILIVIATLALAIIITVIVVSAKN